MSKRVYIELFSTDRELVDCAALYRTYLIETNEHGPKQEAFLRDASVGQLIKMMASQFTISGEYFSKEVLGDRIAAVRRQKQSAQGSNAA